MYLPFSSRVTGHFTLNRKGTDLSVRPLPAYELLLSSCFGKSMCGLVLGDHFVEFEDGQEHGDHDAADDHA